MSDLTMQFASVSLGVATGGPAGGAAALGKITGERTATGIVNFLAEAQRQRDIERMREEGNLPGQDPAMSLRHARAVTRSLRPDTVEDIGLSGTSGVGSVGVVVAKALLMQGV